MNDTFFGRLGDVITNPGRLMDNVGARPAWWQAGLAIFLVMIVFSYMVLPISAPEQVEMMRNSRLSSMIPEDVYQQQYEDALNMPQNQRIIQSVSSGFFTWVSVLVFGFILGFFARMSGGKGTMRQALGVVSWGAMPVFLVSSLVKLPLILATESVFKVAIGPAALLPNADPGSTLYQILMVYGDLFTWWGLILLIIGFERVFNMARSVAAVSVLLPWAVLTLIPLGIQIFLS
jgi:hypothetical protein